MKNQVLTGLLLISSIAGCISPMTVSGSETESQQATTPKPSGAPPPSPSPFAPSANLTSNLSIVREAHGTMRYRNVKTGEVTGSERFSLTVHPDGSRTVQARNSIYKYDMQRHVIHRVEKNFRPLDTSAVYWVLGQWRGTGLFSVVGKKLHAVVKTPKGILTEDITVPQNFSLVPHPLSTNAWHGWYYDHEKGGKQEIQWYNLDAGALTERSMLGKIVTETLEYFGQEKLTTPAGTFLVDHFKVGSVDYYTTGPDKIMVKFSWNRVGIEYLLTELTTKGYDGSGD